MSISINGVVFCVGAAAMIVVVYRKCDILLARLDTITAKLGVGRMTPISKVSETINICYRSCATDERAIKAMLFDTTTF